MMRNKVRNYIKTKKEILKKEILSKYLVKKTKKESDNKFHINSSKTNINVFRIRNKEQIITNLENNYFENYYQGYVIPLKLNFDTINYISEVDIAICDLSWKVIKIYTFVPQNTKFEKFHETVHIVVFSKNTISYLGLKINDKLTPF